MTAMLAHVLCVPATIIALVHGETLIFVASEGVRMLSLGNLEHHVLP